MGLTTKTGGYFTPGFGAITGAYLSGSARIPVDTNLTSGAQPQSGSIIPGTLPAPAADIGVTALAGGGKTSAVQLDYGVTQISVCATAANSVKLPYAFPGAVCFIANDGAAAAQVFGRGTDTIDAVATGTGVALTNAKRAWFIGIAGSGDGTDAGAWVSLKADKSA